jgi:hypothetical protein
MSETYTDVNGTIYTGADIERWAAVEATEAGYTGGHLGAPIVGRPVSVGHQARPFTLRLDGARRAKLDEIARDRHTTASQIVRDLIDAL